MNAYSSVQKFTAKPVKYPMLDAEPLDALQDTLKAIIE
jgi:hypothetical protein